MSKITLYRIETEYSRKSEKHDDIRNLQMLWFKTKSEAEAMIDKIENELMKELLPSCPEHEGLGEFEIKEIKVPTDPNGLFIWIRDNVGMWPNSNMCGLLYDAYYLAGE